MLAAGRRAPGAWRSWSYGYATVFGELCNLGAAERVRKRVTEYGRVGGATAWATSNGY